MPAYASSTDYLAPSLPAAVPASRGTPEPLTSLAHDFNRHGALSRLGQTPDDVLTLSVCEAVPVAAAVVAIQTARAANDKIAVLGVSM